MASLAEFQSSYWTDYNGVKWPVIKSGRRLKFKYPSHAAVRAHIFHRDNFRCVRCGVSAINVPKNYSGRHALSVETVLASGFHDTLIVDHVVTLKAGGKNSIENFQSLCETCNKRKQREDNAISLKFREFPGSGKQGRRE